MSRAGGAAFGKQPSLMPFPNGILPHPQSLHAMPFKASRKRKDFRPALRRSAIRILATLSDHSLSLSD
jgi:hypothetical protein